MEFPGQKAVPFLVFQGNSILFSTVAAPVKKLWYTYTMEFYTAERKKELLSFATAWMELESIILSEISQAVRDKYRMILPLTGT